MGKIGIEPTNSPTSRLSKVHRYRTEPADFPKCVPYKLPVLATVSHLRFTHQPFITSSALSATHRLSQSRCSLISTDKVFCGCFPCEFLCQPPFGRKWERQESNLQFYTLSRTSHIRRLPFRHFPMHRLLRLFFQKEFG